MFCKDEHTFRFVSDDNIEYSAARGNVVAPLVPMPFSNQLATSTRPRLDDVYASELSYIEKGSLVVVGFNFGGILMVSLRTQKVYVPVLLLASTSKLDSFQLLVLLCPGADQRLRHSRAGGRSASPRLLLGRCGYAQEVRRLVPLLDAISF